MKTKLSRRTMLRGAAGAAVALPLLEAMMPEGTAQAQSNNAPKRYILTFGGFSLNKGTSSETGTIQQFQPDNYGPGYDIKPAVAPLMNYQDIDGNPVRDEVSVVSGLDIPHAQSLNPQPPASRYIGDSFHFHTGPLLCGVKQIHELDAEVIGQSSDQIVAQAIAGATLFPFLNYRVQASFYNPVNQASAGSHHRDTMAFEDLGGTINAIPAQTSPRQAWLALTTPFSDGSDVAQQLELRKRKSVLDLVDRRMAGLLPKLSKWDRDRLDRHYTEVRAIENLLDATAPTNAQCMPIADPMADPPIGGDFNAPFDFSVNKGYSDEDARARTFTKLVHMAMVCDLSRVCTMMYTIFQSFMNIHPLIGASFNQHAMNHNGTQSQLNDVIAWHVDHFAELVSLLRDTPEGDGTLLDNCAVAMLTEGGYFNGAHPPGGWSHNTTNMNFLMAGGAGGLKRGEHIDVSNAANKHPAHFLVSLMQAVGVNTNQLGEISGNIPEIFS